MNIPKLLQLLPADGWKVAYLTDDGGDYAEADNVVAFALTADGKIIGIVPGAGLDFAERQTCRLKYFKP